jgi:hypothetical protein
MIAGRQEYGGRPKRRSFEGILDNLQLRPVRWRNLLVLWQGTTTSMLRLREISSARLHKGGSNGSNTHGRLRDNLLHKAASSVMHRFVNGEQSEPPASRIHNLRQDLRMPPRGKMLRAEDPKTIKDSDKGS